MKQQFETLLAEMEKGLSEMRPEVESARAKCNAADKEFQSVSEMEQRLRLAIQHLKRAIDTLAEEKPA